MTDLTPQQLAEHQKAREWAATCLTSLPPDASRVLFLNELLAQTLMCLTGYDRNMACDMLSAMFNARARILTELLDAPPDPISNVSDRLQ